jgi:hypothetical protein
MPFSYKVDPENQLITIMGSGYASMEERYECIHRIMKDQSIDGKYSILINVCQVSNGPTPDNMLSIVSLVERLQSKFGGRVAIVNTQIGHVTITNLIALSAHCGADSVRAFLCENDALEWLCTSTPLPSLLY